MRSGIKREFKKTGDGSQTIYLPDLDETYHSVHGAIQEAKHVFIQQGLQHFHEKNTNNDPIHILEMGLGTGLNAFLAAIWAAENNRQVIYCGIEAFPVDIEMNRAMDYPKSLGHSQLFETLITAPWEESISLSNNFQLLKIERHFEEFQAENAFDVLFYDAFGPRAQEEMWNEAVIAHACHFLKPGGIFVTYCAKGQLRRDLKNLNLLTERLPGPPGKREMTRATRPFYPIS